MGARDVIWVLFMAEVLMGAGCALFVVGTYMLFRNAWVYRERMRLLHTDRWRYERLASYDAMMWQFWVWNIRGFER